MDIGKRIRSARKEVGMSAEELAEKIGVSPSTIYRYESNDISNMGIDKLKSIAEVLHTHAYSLLGWDSPESNPRYIYLLSLLDTLDGSGLDKIISYAQDICASGKYSASRTPSEPDIDAALKDINGLCNVVAKRKE